MAEFVNGVARLAGYPARLVAIPAAASAGTRDPDEASTSCRARRLKPFVQYLSRRTRAPAQIYLDTVKELRAGLTTMLLGMDRTLTPTQRRKAIATIQKLIDDVHSL